MSFAKSVLTFYQQLQLSAKLPGGVQVMNPYKEKEAIAACKRFYNKYYADNFTRKVLLGINPGRFGSGTTGISFTDPVQLQTACGIDNPFPKKPELSSDFIYRMISAFGGPAVFYKHYFISAVSPLGFVKDGKNINYYDDARLQKAVTPFIISSLTQLTELPLDRSVCFCIGEGKNFEFIRRLNEEYHWFDDILPLAHPRFVMQYKRKMIDQYIRQYLDALQFD